MKLHYGSQQVKKTTAWKHFSEYIRRSDPRCFSCGIKKNWQDLDAGHYIPGSTCGKELYFSEINVHPQCTSCNRFKHGNGSEYALALTRKYGNTILEYFDEIRKVEKKKGIICRFSKVEIQEISEKYKALNKELITKIR